MGSVSASPDAPNMAPQLINKRLQEEYLVGKVLGEGAFGVVHTCIRRSDGEELAVKMYKEVAVSSEVRTEIELLRWLSHYNVVTFHGVFMEEEGSVCMVLAKYCGGDLVDGLHYHQNHRGKINSQCIVHVCAQMAAAVQYLHSWSIVHRDIKGDNFLIDRKDITDLQCHVALSDFGIAKLLEPEQRLSAPVGTKQFWSPEFFDGNYGFKVDIWAMGVLLFGLLEGRFPFKDEHAIKTQEPKWPEGMHPDCEDYLKGMFHKRESKRSSADFIAAHNWIKVQKPKHSDGRVSPLVDIKKPQHHDGRVSPLVDIKKPQHHDGRVSPLADIKNPRSLDVKILHVDASMPAHQDRASCVDVHGRVLPQLPQRVEKHGQIVRVAKLGYPSKTSTKQLPTLLGGRCSPSAMIAPHSLKGTPQLVKV